VTDVFEVKIRPYHCDALGHVNNARYLEFLEEGRWAFWEARGGFEVFDRRDWVFMVVKIDVNYREAVNPHETVRVSTHLAGLGNRSGRLRQEIHRAEDGALVTDADVVFVIVDGAGGKALAMSEVAAEILPDSDTARAEEPRSDPSS
jgi:thioesterase-3